MEMKLHQALSVHESHRATASARHVQRARCRTAGWRAFVDSFPSGHKASFGGVHAVGAHAVGVHAVGVHAVGSLDGSLAKIVVLVLRCTFGFVNSFLQGPNAHTSHKRWKSADLKQTHRVR